MPKGYPSLSHEQKQEIINRVREKGEQVADLAKEYGVKPKNIYKLLRGLVSGPNTLLELARLKREKEALLQIIGQLVANNKLGKKS